MNPEITESPICQNCEWFQEVNGLYTSIAHTENISWLFGEKTGDQGSYLYWYKDQNTYRKSK